MSFPPVPCHYFFYNVAPLDSVYNFYTFSQTYQGEANMINSNWVDPCQYMKQDPIKLKKKDTKNNEQDETDMIFIGPDVDMISSTRSSKHIRALITCNYSIY